MRSLHLCYSHIQFPNTSYGEDYAAGLAFSRGYRIEGIYKELYLCRRWGGNSDAALSVEKVQCQQPVQGPFAYHRNHGPSAVERRKGYHFCKGSALTRFFNRQLETARNWRVRNYHLLKNVKSRDLAVGDQTMLVQFNPARIVSTGAKIDAKTLSERPCFLCDKNRPAEQMSKDVDGRFHLLVNPYPILPVHFTIPQKKHQPQRIKDYYGEIHRLLDQYPELMVFYNGPKCGASAPDHMHFQAGTSGLLPLQASWQRYARNLTTVYSLSEDEQIAYINDYPAPALVIKSKTAKSDEQLFRIVYDSLHAVNPSQTSSKEEPMMNIVAWRQGEDYLSVVFLRKKHRPECYVATGEAQLLVSPGALDMSGNDYHAPSRGFREDHTRESGGYPARGEYD